MYDRFSLLARSVLICIKWFTWFCWFYL